MWVALSAKSCAVTDNGMGYGENPGFSDCCRHGTLNGSLSEAPGT